MQQATREGAPRRAARTISHTARSTRFNRAKRAAVLAASVASLAGSARTFGQAVTNTWIGTTSTWSSSAQWQAGSVPTAGAVVQFNNTLAGSYTATNDLGNPFQLLGIVFNSSSSVASTIASAASNSLQFTGANPFITQSGYGSFTISSAFSLAPTSGNFTINGSGLGNLTISGVISDSGGARQVVINGSPSVLNGQIISLTGANAFSGGLRLTSGNLSLGSNNTAPGTGPITIEGGSVQVSSGVVISNNVTLNSTMRFVGSTAGTFSGVLSGTGGVTVSGTTGAPGLNLSGVNTYTGATTIDQSQVFTVNTPASPGQISLVGANGKIDSTTINVRSSGTFNISDSTAAYTGASGFGRIPDSAAINVSGGFLNITSTSGVTASETVGALNIDGGQSVLTLTAGTSAQANMTFTTVSRGPDRGMLFVRGASLGDTPASTKTNVSFGNAGALLVGGGGAAGSQNMSIIPWAAGDRTPSTSGASTTAGSLGFLTNGTNGLRVLASAEYAASFAAITSSTDNLRLTASLNPPSGGATVNSILFQGTSTVGTVGGTDAITFGNASPDSAAAIIYNTNAVTMNAPLAFGGNEGKFFTISTLTANGVISGTNGITKAGTDSTLVLAANNTFGGPLTIDGGTVSFSTAANLGTGNQIIAGGGMLTTASITGGGRARLLYTGAGAITVPHDIKLVSGLFEPRSVSGTTLTLSGTISGPGGILSNSSGTLILAGTNTYTGPTRIFGTAADTIISSDANLGAPSALLDLGATTGIGLQLAGNWTTSRQVNLSATSQLHTQGFTATLNGPMTGASALTKAGSGKMIMTAASPYTGALTISAGTFEMNGTLGPSSSGVTIASSAAVGGTGTIYRTITVSSGGIVAPGQSVGVLTANALSLTTSTLNWESNGSIFDRMDLIGGLTLSGTSTLNLTGAAVSAGSYTLMNFASVTGTASNLAVGTNLGGAFTYTLSLNPTSLVLNVAALSNYTWLGGNGNWAPATAGWYINIPSNPQNWSNGSNATIGDGTDAAGAITVTAPVTANAITFNPAASGNYSVGGASVITVNAGITANETATITAPITLAAPQTWTVANNKSLNVSALVANTTLTKEGQGGLNIAGALTSSAAGININNGSVTFVAGGTSSNGGSFTIGANGTLRYNNALGSNQVSSIANAGTYIIDGSGVTMSGGLSGAGTVNVNNGSLTLSALNSPTGTITLNTSSLTFNSTTTQTISAVIAGAGSVNFSPGSTTTYTLSGNNTFTNGLISNASTNFALGHANGFGAGNVTFGHTAAGTPLTVNSTVGTTATIPNSIAFGNIGANLGTISMPTSGQTITYGGVLSGGNSSATLRLAGNSDDTTVFRFSNTNTLNFGTISLWEGQLAITSAGALGNVGILALNTSTTASGGLRFDADGISIGQTLNFIDSNVLNTQANNATVTGPLVGSGAMTKLGNGKLTLTNNTAANTYTGAITVSSGKLQVDGTLLTSANAFTISSGATLGGSGTLNRPVTVNSGGIVEPGSSVGVLTGSALSVSTTTFNYESNGSIFDRIDLSGALSLTGNSVLNLTGAGVLANNYVLMNYGSRTGTGTILLGTTLGGAFDYALVFNANNLTLSVTQQAASYNWDANPGAAGIQDGDGTWFTDSNPAHQNFFNNTTSGNENWVNSFSSNVTFGSTGGGSVNIDTPVQVNKITFAQNYTLTGAGMTLQSGVTANADGTITAPVTMNAANTFDVAASRTLLVSGGVSEAAAGTGFTKAGSGTLVLVSASHTGNTSVTGGTLSTSNASAGGSGATSQINLSGGTLLATASYTGSQTISLSGTANGIAADSGVTLTRTAPIVGAGGGFTKVGPGTLEMQAPINSTGGVTVAGGTLSLATGGTIAGQPMTVNTGGTVNFANGVTNTLTTLSGNGGRVINPNSLVLSSGGSFSGVIDGAGSINVTGAASLVLNGANSYTGGSTFSSGTATVGNASAFGTGSVVFGSTSSATLLTFNAGNATVANNFALGTSAVTYTITNGSNLNQATTLSGVISGGNSGATISFGGSTTGSSGFVLTNPANTFQGSIELFEGFVAFTSNGALGNPANAIRFDTTNAGQAGLRFDANVDLGTRPVVMTSATFFGQISTQANSGTIGGVVSGPGPLVKTGTGTLTLSGTNTYTGNTTVSFGTLRVNGTHTGAGSYTVAGGANLAGTGQVTLTTGNNVTISGNVAPGASVGKLTLTTVGTGATVMAPGGSYDWEVTDATQGSTGNGVRWDHLALTSLNITATNVAKFIVRVIALPGAGPASLDNFDPDQSYEWQLANSSNNTVTGFSTDKFQVDVSQFENNNTNKGGFYVRYNNTNGDLLLVYVPEPGSAALGLIGAGGMLRRRRR